VFQYTSLGNGSLPNDGGAVTPTFSGHIAPARSCTRLGSLGFSTVRSHSGTARLDPRLLREHPKFANPLSQFFDALSFFG
jgi:hypothetical protein